MRSVPSKPIETNVDTEATADQFRVAAARTTEAPWYVEQRPRRADVRGLPANTTRDYRGDAVATTGDSDFGAMPQADAEFAVMARNNWDRLMAAWDFAVDYARTSGDGPTCECVPCRAARAIGVARYPAQTDATVALVEHALEVDGADASCQPFAAPQAAVEAPVSAEESSDGSLGVQR